MILVLAVSALLNFFSVILEIRDGDREGALLHAAIVILLVWIIGLLREVERR